MAKEYIEREAVRKKIEDFHHTSHIQSLTRETEEAKRLWRGIHSGVNYCRNTVIDAPAADVIEIDKVAAMFNDFCGDYCACNYNIIDEWLPFCCDFIEECTEPKDPLGCWKQFVKHYNKRNINFLE